MASGVPVVVSDKGGPKEIVQHGRTGLVTRARNAADLVQGIEHLIKNPSIRREMAVYARAYAEKQSWDKIYLNFWNG